MQPMIWIGQPEKVVGHVIAIRVGNVLIPYGVPLVVNSMFWIESRGVAYENGNSDFRLACVGMPPQGKVGEFLGD